jgi:poly [ADP-ribose] polymerase
MIEAAKTGRANCRSCKKPIEKGQLRLGEEVPNAFAPGEMTFNWHHLACAAQKKPGALKQALETTEMEIPDRSELEKTIEVSAKNEKPTTYPYAEKAPTSRSTCLGCSEKIEKGALRIAVENEMDTGMFVRRGAGYLHAGCAVEHTGEEAAALFETIQGNSPNLSEQDLETLEGEMVS